MNEITTLNPAKLGEASNDADISPEEGQGVPFEEATRNLGLKRIPAWVLDPDSPQGRSKSAERTRRARQKAQQKGNTPLSVSMPTELHKFVQDLARRTGTGEPVANVLAELVVPFLAPPVPAIAPAASPFRKRLQAWLRKALDFLLRKRER